MMKDGSQSVCVNNRFEILTSNGFEDFESIIKNENVNKISKHIKFIDETHIKATYDHRFFIGGKEIKTCDLQVGDILDSINEGKCIVDISDIVLKDTFEIFNTKSHTILANDVISHQCDEFAFVPPNIARKFYTALYPTLSADPTAKFIITSTANGVNQFSDILVAAKAGNNKFKAHQVDWWQVPGRDTAWKKSQIQNLGSEEAFEQEYGNKIYMNSDTLATSDQRKILGKYQREFQISKDDTLYSKVNEVWLRDFKVFGEPIDPYGNRKYVISIDFAEGIGADYTVVQIFEITPLSPHQLKNPRIVVKNEYDLFGLSQVAVWRDNKTDLNNCADGLSQFLFNYMNPDNYILIVEANDYRWTVMDSIFKENVNYAPEVYMKTLQSNNAKQSKVGVRLNRNNKKTYFNALRRFVESRKIKIRELSTIEEFLNFMITEKGEYMSQTGHDDAVMACLNCIPVFEDPIYYEFIDDIYQEAYEDKFGIDVDFLLETLKKDSGEISYKELIF